MVFAKKNKILLTSKTSDFAISGRISALMGKMAVVITIVMLYD